MEYDPILLEVHAQKKQLAMEASFDLHSLCEKLRQNESLQTERLAVLQSLKPEKVLKLPFDFVGSVGNVVKKILGQD